MLLLFLFLLITFLPSDVIGTNLTVLQSSITLNDSKNLVSLKLVTDKGSPLYNKSIAVVTNENQLLCKPFVFSAAATSLKILQNSVLVSLGNQTWMSNSGGCMFHLLVDANEKLSANTIVYHTAIDKLTLTTTNNMMGKTNGTHFWNSYGIIEVVDPNRQHFHFTRALPISNKPIVTSQLNFEEGVLNVQPGYTWPNSIVGNIVICFYRHLSCRVMERMNDTAVNTSCSEATGTCDRMNWFIDELYIQSTTCFNASLLYPELTTYVTNHSLKVNDTLYGNEFQIKITNATSPANFEVINGTNITGIHNVCFAPKYTSLSTLLWQPLAECPYKLELKEIANNTIYLDSRETSSFLVEFRFQQRVPSGLRDLKFIRASLLSSKSINIHTVYSSYRDKHTMRVTLRQKWQHAGEVTLSFSSIFTSQACQPVNVYISGACHNRRELVYQHPLNISQTQLLQQDVTDSQGYVRVLKLPVNYQPPSSLGVNIPMTSNVYNADPSKAMHKKRYLGTQPYPVFKQCNGQSRRELCSCEATLKASQKVSESDCISRVFRLSYSEKFTPRLYINTHRGLTTLETTYRMSELNNRTKFTILDGSAEQMTSTSSLKFLGSGLHHFRAEITAKNVSFCKLQTEFIVYVDGAPMAFPAQKIVQAISALLFGGTIFGAFVFQLYKAEKN